MKLADHPGNLGPSRGTVLSIHHADWPAYPLGENFFETLYQLTAFPPKTPFLEVDDIDRSTLLIADVKGGVPNKPHNQQNFHIAAWHEDLIQLQDSGYIDGVVPSTEAQWERNRWDKMIAERPRDAGALGYENPVTEKFTPLIPPPIPEAHDEEDDYEEEKPFVCIPSGKIHVTPSGRQFVLESLQTHVLSESLSALPPKIRTLFHLRYYDTCIREACVHLEHEIKVASGSGAWGDRLVEKFISTIKSNGQFLESYVRTFRQELRSVFKLIRNDYMHNLSESDEASAAVLLTRVSRVFTTARILAGTQTNVAPI